MTRATPHAPEPPRLPRRRIPGWLARYGSLPRPLYHLAAGQFLINLITSAQFLLLNLFLKSQGLEDPAIAALGSQRFVATLLLALPAGLWLRGKPLRKPLFIGSILFPCSALAALEAVRLGHLTVASGCFLFMGFASLLLSVASLPMALRLTPEDQSSEALSLLFATWAAASVCGGLLSGGLQAVGSITVGGTVWPLDEHATLLVLTLVAFLAPVFQFLLPDPVPEKPRSHQWFHVDRAEWPLLTRALVPTLCIATGAGLSIQFLNLFFNHVHGVGSKDYAWYGSANSVLVLIAGLMVPEVKRRLGWRGAILGVQGVAVLLLVVMGLTETVKAASWALPVAVACFILRQPLMSMAGPAISELTMSYVGERNRELVSACSGAIWSGAWWLAARTFQILRAHDFPYWMVFLTTAALYFAGTVAYLGLIRSVEEREAPVGEPA
ncbi:putative MFS family arabinose efflux permease [Haloferula luteola]|uniref:Putative MFS family arabinose efflux permease n=1 Tax=Haloferula luteola TaxID=595692 RepID=A0A840UUF4_9BACT|nr:MFS transporter [Haloferula luteola]MBB5349827.1 putative MFS family arabinose efflux permease [Haloferula luteola]